MKLFVTEAKESTLSERTKINYNGVDLMKFICMFLVWAIHVKPFSNDSIAVFEHLNFVLQKYVCRIAVPFFFMTSGFFLFGKMEQNPQENVVKHYCINLLRLLGTWSVLLFVGGVYHLWYIRATVVAVTLLAILLKKGLKLKWLLLLAVVFYIIGLSGDAYYGITARFRLFRPVDYGVTTYEFFFYSTRNGVFMGLIFVLLGAVWAKKRIRMPLGVAFIGFVVSMCLLLCEALMVERLNLAKDHNMYIFLVPATSFLFFVALGLELKDRPIYKCLRSISVLGYFLHLLVAVSIDFVFDKLESFAAIDCKPFLFAATVLLTLALSCAIEHLSHKEKFRWLRWLYS